MHSSEEDLWTCKSKLNDSVLKNSFLRITPFCNWVSRDYIILSTGGRKGFLSKSAKWKWEKRYRFGVWLAQKTFDNHQLIKYKRIHVCFFFFSIDRLKTVPKILQFTLFLQQEVSLIPFYTIPVCYSFLPKGKAQEPLNLFLWKKGKEGEKKEKSGRCFHRS